MRLISTAFLLKPFCLSRRMTFCSFAPTFINTTVSKVSKASFIPARSSPTGRAAIFSLPSSRKSGPAGRGVKSAYSGDSLHFYTREILFKHFQKINIGAVNKWISESNKGRLFAFFQLSGNPLPGLLQYSRKSFCLWSSER